MLLLHLSILFAVCQAHVRITGCLEDHKQCLGYPEGCLGEQCKFTYSTIVKGNFMEVEVLGDRVYENFYVAAAYSSDDKMGDDYVLFCARNNTKKEIDKANMGVAWNTDRATMKAHNVSVMDHEMTKKLKVEYLEIKLDERERFYCKFRHLVQPIRELSNGTDKPTILMATGLMMHGKLAYHARDRNVLGQIDLNNQGSRPRKSSTTPSTILTNLMALGAYMFVVRVY